MRHSQGREDALGVHAVPLRPSSSGAVLCARYDSGVPLDLSDAGAEMHSLSDLIDKGLDALRLYAHESAAAERDYRHPRASSWLATPRERDGLKLTAGEREAMVDAETAEA